VARTRSVLTTESEFDEFLYASIGESNGSFLSVLSVLARLNLDPWDEAARLARLPREAASRFLADLIAAPAAGSPERADAEVEAKRLTALLPRRVSGGTNARVRYIGHATARPRLIRYLVYCIVLTIVFFGSQWLMERSRDDTRPGTKLGGVAASNVAPIAAPQHD
jgi:hypothetical protein